MPEKSEMIFSYYAHTLANRRYGTLADDLFDQNFVKIKSTAVEGAHSIYIEKWRSLGVIDVESTVPKSGFFYDLWDTRQDEINAGTNQFDLPVLTWVSLNNTGLGISGPNNSPDLFLSWRNNLASANTSQSFFISELFRFYGIQ